jgi:hypothetical protein
MGRPSGVIDTETRWEQARWLLHDDSLKPEDRPAGLLVLLYAQRTSAISRLTLGHVQAADGQVLIRLDREPVVLPEPLDALALHATAARRGHASLGDDGTSAWLFPGGQLGQPISAFQVGERLRKLGIRCGQSRSAALFQLATDLPAAVLANMLGIHISVAVQWQRASAGDWTAYAADPGHRPACPSHRDPAAGHRAGSGESKQRNKPESPSGPVVARPRGHHPAPLRTQGVTSDYPDKRQSRERVIPGHRPITRAKEQVSK